jgi:hypothetical protein
MTWLSVVLKELLGLFVDDGLFALSILIWLALGWMLPRFGLPNVLTCILFAVGLAALLAASTLRCAGKRQ